MRRASAFFAAVAVFLVVSEAAANDSAFGGAGGSVFPVEEDRIRMVSERVEMRLVEGESAGESEWHVTVRHRFRNTTDSDVELQTGFPELGCRGDHECPSDYAIEDLETRIDGEEVETRVRKVNTDGKPELSFDDLDRVHLFDLAFEPGAERVVEHTYTHPPSGGVDTKLRLEYLTRTGALWKGELESATFVVRIPFRHYDVYYPAGYELVDRTHSTAIDGDWQYTFQMEDWVPARNFTMKIPRLVGDRHFYTSGQTQSEPLRCPTAVAGAPRCGSFGMDADEMREHVYSVFVEEFRNWEPDDGEKPSLETHLRNCRNFPYAVHGYRFQDDALFNRFYGSAVPETTGMWLTFQSDDNAKSFGLWPNPEFSTELLSRADWRYVRAVDYVSEHLEALEAEFGDDGSGDSRSETDGVKDAGTTTAPDADEAADAGGDEPPAIVSAICKGE